MSFLKITEIRQSGGVTHRFAVDSNSGMRLGRIQWWAAWRRYCFYPEGVTVFDSNCLKEIAAFCDKLMVERKIR